MIEYKSFSPAFLILLLASALQGIAEDNKPEILRAGIVGLDTSHCIAFTKILNQAKPGDEAYGCRVVAAYPKGSPDIESSVSRVPGYTERIQKEYGVEIVGSIAELLKKVDVVLLETNDGRPHLEQVLPVLKAGKPVFVDKPVAGSLDDAIAIYEAAKLYDVPLFSSSSMRFYEDPQAIRNGKVGDVRGCSTYGTCSLESTHPDFFWYGIHAVEMLFTCMGTGCKSVTRTATPEMDMAVGEWEGGRIGSFRGLRGNKAGFGGTVFGTKAITQMSRDARSYQPMLVEIVKFFQTGEPPVSAEETLEIYAFMEAADESKRQGGVPVTLKSVMDKARTATAWNGQWDGGGQHTGELKCLARQIEGDQWEAIFTGYCNRQFVYEVKMKGTKKGNRIVFAGDADLGEKDGGTYQWTGEIINAAFTGKYESDKGKAGEFKMDRIQPSDAN